MIRCLFSSVHGGNALKKAILAQLDDLLVLEPNAKVSVSIFAFSLTDEDIANKILFIAKNYICVDFRIIADWSQRGIKGNKQLYGLSLANLHNISIRYKLDQPYIQSENDSRIKWSYRESQGLLHHKTLSVSINGRFEYLILGSFNWTKRATNYYENLLILYPDNNAILEVFHKFQIEFDFMWNDSAITASPTEANNHFHYIKSKLAQSAPETLVFCDFKENAALAKTSLSKHNNAILVAFNSKGMNQEESQRGYHPKNHDERFTITKPSGKQKSVPLNITNLVLEIIFKARAGDTLKIASYALSAKAVEFGTLIEAARRNVTIYILLDKKINSSIVQMIESKYASLPIQVRTTSKRLHSKYIIHQASNTVLTGTANFTMDASKRHSEHRLLLQDNEKVTNAFLEDFQTIWDRVKKREKDKPRLFLSNNGYDATDIPYSKYRINFINYKIFSKLFLFLCHKYLHIKYYLRDSTDKSENISIDALLQIIENKANLQSFKVFLIGSYIDYLKGLKENHSSDIDLCICPCDDSDPKYSEIENFILWVRAFGLRHKISFDIKYCKIAPNVDDITLNPNQRIHFIKLYSPYLQHKVSKGVLQNHIFLGRYLIKFELKAKDTNFFKKLPQSTENSNKKYLRGAIALGTITWSTIYQEK